MLLPAGFFERLDAAEASAWLEYLEATPPEDRLWLLEADGSPAGFCRTGPARDGDLPAGSGEIYGLYLDPERTGRGLGATLLAHALADLRTRGFGEIAVWPFEENERAFRLYERSGFRRDGARREWTQEGASAVEVRLRLAPETGVDAGFTPPRPPA